MVATDSRSVAIEETARRVVVSGALHPHSPYRGRHSGGASRNRGLAEGEQGTAHSCSWDKGTPAFGAAKPDRPYREGCQSWLPGYGYAAHCAPTLYPLKQEDKAIDARYTAADCLNRSHGFGRHFDDYAFEAVRDFGERLAKAHGLSSAAATFAAPFVGITTERYLWRQGLAAEEAAPKLHATQNEFASALRHHLADWTDFDVAAAHTAMATITSALRIWEARPPIRSSDRSTTRRNSASRPSTRWNWPK